MLNQSKILRASLRLAALVAGSLLLAACSSSGCGGTRDYLLVIDTSGSMAGQRDTIGKVKTSIPSFLKSVEPGDTVTLLRFATEPEISETIRIDEEADKEKVVAEVQAMQAKGAYTDMGAMMQLLRKEAARLESDARDLVIVVMSDGRDDPPPWAKRDSIELKEFEDAGTQDRPQRADYIYYISLGKIKDPGLEQSLGELGAEGVKTIEPETRAERADGEGAASPTDDAASGDGEASGEDGAGADESAQAADEIGLAEVARDVEESAWERALRRWGVIGLIVVGVIVLLLLLLLLARAIMNRHKLDGLLRYYEADVGQPVKSDFPLDKLGKSRMTLGSKLGADLRIKQSGLPQNVHVKAKSLDGEKVLVPAQSDLAFFQFLDQKKQGVISKGDRFKLGNYILEYGDGGDN